jgi:ankyrin repeat protein
MPLLYFPYQILTDKKIMSSYMIIDGARKGQLEIVQAAVLGGNDVNMTKYYGHGRTALYIASECGYIDIVRYLVHHGADKEKSAIGDQTPLYIAAAEGHLGVVQYLVEAGADKEKADEDGRTPLFIAAVGGYLEVVQDLLQRGADKDTATQDGWTPLLAATQDGHVGVVQYLVQQ